MAKLNVYLSDHLSEWLEARKSRAPINVSKILQQALVRELDREIYLSSAHAEKRVGRQVADATAPGLADEEAGHSYVIGCELAVEWAARATDDDLAALAAPRTLAEEFSGLEVGPEAERIDEALGQRPDPDGMRADSRLRLPVIKNAMRVGLQRAAERNLYEFDRRLASRGFLDTVEEIWRGRRGQSTNEQMTGVQLGRFAARSWMTYAPRSAWSEVVALAYDDNQRELYRGFDPDGSNRRHIEAEINKLLRRVVERAYELELPSNMDGAYDAFIDLVVETWEAADPKRRLFHVDAELGAEVAVKHLAELNQGQKIGLLGQLALADLTPSEFDDEATFVDAHHPLPDIVEHGWFETEKEWGPLDRFRFLLGYVHTVWRELAPLIAERSEAKEAVAPEQ